MSFLAGRLAGKEAAYFFQESKQAVNRIAEKSPSAASKPFQSTVPESPADVLPEVLRHSLPSSIFGKPSDPSSLSTASKWSLPSDPNKPLPVSSDALNPLRAYVSLPQVTFGPKRWELPAHGGSVLASTANDLRKDRYAPMNPEKLKAAAEGLKYVGKAFAVATAAVFGGAILVFSLAASKLEMHTSADIRSKGKDLVQPKLESIKEKLVPLRTWAENTSKKWHINKEEDIKEKPMVKEISKLLGVRKST